MTVVLACTGARAEDPASASPDRQVVFEGTLGGGVRTWVPFQTRPATEVAAAARLSWGDAHLSGVVQLKGAVALPLGLNADHDYSLEAGLRARFLEVLFAKLLVGLGLSSGCAMDTCWDLLGAQTTFELGAELGRGELRFLILGRLHAGLVPFNGGHVSVMESLAAGVAW